MLSQNNKKIEINNPIDISWNNPVRSKIFKGY